MTLTTGGTMTQTIDTPSNVFATANSLIPNGNITYSNGNLNTAVSTYSGQWRSTISTLGASSGKYAEYKITNSRIGSICWYL